ncbi:Amino-acid acetyltransferase, mitochondrial [Acarospora aff. strigata]|nr:Amino-acid acetyltransferase, mitochondrial [Acarospora aff. strigata]
MQDFFLDILSSTSTKREAKSYISRFHPSKKSPLPKTAAGHSNKSREISEQISKSTPSNAPGVNLGSFYAPAKAVDESPVFRQGPVSKPVVDNAVEPLHVALVKIRAPQLLDNTALEGIGLTLSQLARLGLGCVVVVDCDEELDPELSNRQNIYQRRMAIAQADRVVAGIESNDGSGARRLDSIIEFSAPSGQSPSGVEIRRGARVTHRNILLAPLRRGVIPVISPVGYMPSTHTLQSANADEIMYALTREFAGIQATPSADEEPIKASKRVNLLQKQTSLDRIILLDPAGGIPSQNRANGSHVFINLDQEFIDINAELHQLKDARNHGELVQFPRPETTLSKTEAGKIFNTEKTELERPSPNMSPENQKYRFSQLSAAEAHLRNMQLLQQTLALLPPSSSALITTPQEAANSGKSLPVPFQASGVGTRRQRNPLIHNLLTDKPIFSSSLPAGRLVPVGVAGQASTRAHGPPTTFVKRGMPLTILPDPRISAWTAPGVGEARLTLEDPRIDLPRLVHLIDDSFSRKLDVKHYLERVNDRIAGVIIAGEYEGGALLTWETPPGVPNDDTEATRLRKVPYLDKFAVLKRSQGAGGVADIVFNAMVRDCFPNGVCWRSRRDNPVNKWYFERVRGTWKIPGSNWTMFWTTEGVVQNEQTFLDYEGVCRLVAPSWADNKAFVD